MVNRHGRMIPSVHPALVPRHGAMAGNVLVLGVVCVLEATCLFQDMLPSDGLVPTMGHMVGADEAHQAAKRAGADQQIWARGDRRWVVMQMIIVGVHRDVSQRALGLAHGLCGR